jgi:hypothetical protein
MDGGRHPDHSGTENKYVTLWQGCTFPRFRFL